MYFFKKSIHEEGARCQSPMKGRSRAGTGRLSRPAPPRFFSGFCGTTAVRLRFRKLTQWYGHILVRQLISSPSIVNQTPDPSLSLYLPIHAPAALMVSDRHRPSTVPTAARGSPASPPRGLCFLSSKVVVPLQLDAVWECI